MDFNSLKKLFIKEYKEPDYNFLRSLPETEYESCLKKIYHKRTGLRLNLKNPKRFNEKIQYLKLHDNMRSKSIYTDKAAVRDYYMEKIGDNAHLKEYYGIYNSFDEIDFQKLPDEFLMQVNHGSKMLIKIKNKQIFLKEGLVYTKQMFEGWLNYNFAFCAGFEMQYMDIKPKIIIEKLYKPAPKMQKIDIMFFCFDGQPEYVETVIVCAGNEKDKTAFYNTEWMPYKDCIQGIKPEYFPIEKPLYLDEMLEISKKLSAGFKFVRVDFMIVNDKFYFLELTFTPNSGFVRFQPDKYDFYFGKFLKI